MPRSRYMTAAEAARTLGISIQTLYAYVSRGLIRSEPATGRTRARRYYAEDVQKLQQRREQRRDPSHAVSTALHWGAPVLESAITLIADGRLYYRGRDAIELAMSHSVEQVAALIWTGDVEAVPRGLHDESFDLPPRCRTILDHLHDLTPIERIEIVLPLAAADDLAAYDLRAASVIQTNARLLRLLVTIAAGEHDSGRGIAETLRHGWAANQPDVSDLLSAALILCADHELNVSSFTARCVASAGSTPYAVVLAGLAALQGVNHGGHTERVAALLREVGTPANARSTITARLKRGEKLPGFGHTLYPDGDPRATALIEMVTAARPESPAVALVMEIVQATHALIGEHPTIDLGLVLLAEALNLPPGSPLAIFAIGRSIGWLGHALEQYAQGTMIRPRARYTGPQPTPHDS